MSEQRTPPQDSPSLLGGLDGFAKRLGRFSRSLRILLAGVIALIFTGGLTLLVYNVLFQIRPDQIADAQTILTLSLVGLATVGFGLYWLGWRLLVGFDFGETPLQPGRVAALWVIVGVVALLVMLAVAAISVVEALVAA